MTDYKVSIFAEPREKGFAEFFRNKETKEVSFGKLLVGFVVLGLVITLIIKLV